MQTTWILTADSSRARIFEEIDDEHHLMEIEDFANPAGHAADLELTSDQQGRFYGKAGGGQAHTAPPREDPVMHQNELFSKTVGEFLDQARSEHRYGKLYVIAPPKFLGLLRKNMSKEAQKLVADEIDKDISWYDRNGIEEFVRGWRH